MKKLYPIFGVRNGKGILSQKQRQAHQDSDLIKNFKNNLSCCVCNLVGARK